MPRLLRVLGATTLALGLALPAARAQLNIVHVNVAAGVSLPTSDYSDFNSSGYNVTGGLGFTPPGLPIGIRVEGFYNEFDYKSDYNTSTDKSHAGGVTGNVTFDLFHSPGVNVFSVYGIGGVGYYSTRNRLQYDSQGNVGYNIGGGVRIPIGLFSAYVEARYHTVSNVDVSFVPIVFGLVF